VVFGQDNNISGRTPSGGVLSTRGILLAAVCISALLQLSAAGQVSRPSIDVPARYNSVQVPPDAKRSISFTVENTGTQEKKLNLSLSGMNASFEDGTSFKDTLKLDSDSRRDFTAIVQPQSEGTKSFRISATNRDTLLTTSQSIPVESRELTAVDEREVPGITPLYALLIFAGALAFFWVS
jgi:hypothetical protein